MCVSQGIRIHNLFIPCFLLISSSAPTHSLSSEYPQYLLCLRWRTFSVLLNTVTGADSKTFSISTVVASKATSITHYFLTDSKSRLLAPGEDIPRQLRLISMDLRILPSPCSPQWRPSWALQRSSTPMFSVSPRCCIFVEAF